MSDTIFGIDRGILKAFTLMILIVGALTTFFLSEYVAAVLLGSVFYTSNNGTQYTQTTVTAESFTVYNTTTAITSLANENILAGTISVYNGTTNVVIGLANFTINYTAGNISATNNAYNNTILQTNYTFQTESVSKIPITDDASTFLDAAEDDFITTFTSVNTGVKFAAALIVVVAVIMVFASFLPKKRSKEKAKEEMGY